MSLADIFGDILPSRVGKKRRPEDILSAKTQDRMPETPAVPVAFDTPLLETPAFVGAAPRAELSAPMAAPDITKTLAAPMAQWKEQRQRDMNDERWAKPEPRGIAGPVGTLAAAPPPMPATRYAPDGRPLAPSPAELRQIQANVDASEGGRPNDAAAAGAPSLTFGTLGLDGAPRASAGQGGLRTPQPGTQLAEALPGATLPDLGAVVPNPAPKIQNDLDTTSMAGLLKQLLAEGKPAGVVQAAGSRVQQRPFDLAAALRGTAGPLLVRAG